MSWFFTKKRKHRGFIYLLFKLYLFNVCIYLGLKKIDGNVILKESDSFVLNYCFSYVETNENWQLLPGSISAFTIDLIS